jgi:hypothetical protein
MYRYRYKDIYRHRWTSISILISAISDVRHQYLLFRYRKKICRTENCHSDIGSVPLSTSEFFPISKKDFYHIHWNWTQAHQFHRRAPFLLANVLIWDQLDVGYWIKLYSDIRYNVGLRFIQSDIGSSDKKLSPISLITDIGVSAHLWI